MKRIKLYNEFINEEISFGKIITGIALSALGFFKPFQATAQHFDDKLIKEIKIDLNKSQDFQKKLDKCVENSRKWWTDRLTSAKTKQRLQNFHGLTDEETDSYIKRYLELVNNFKVIVFDNLKLGEEHKSTAGMVVNNVPRTVFISYNNCKNYDEKTLTNVISHEVQHLLDLILETTPYQFIKGIFSDYQRPEFEDSSVGIKRISSEFNINELEASEYEELISELRSLYIKELGKEYLESEKEINARVRDMRDYFGKSVNDKITVEDIKNYVREGRSLDGLDASVDLFLAHWAELGYPDLSTLLKSLNLLTKDSDNSTFRI
jgi:hypothetical protein